jgi:hypothetical protein
MAGWLRVVPIATSQVKKPKLNRVSVKKWSFGRRPSASMLTVDDRQFEMRYAPIACGLQLMVVGCALSSILAAIWWFFFRG